MTMNKSILRSRIKNAIKDGKEILNKYNLYQHLKSFHAKYEYERQSKSIRDIPDDIKKIKFRLFQISLIIKKN